MRTHPITRRRFIEMLGFAGAVLASGVNRSTPRQTLRVQLELSGRVRDLNGGRIPITEIEEIVYLLRRHRMNSAPHHTIDTIDVLAPFELADRFKNVLHASYYNRYGTFEYKDGVAVLNDDLPYLLVDMPNAGCRLAIISAPIVWDELWFIDLADLSIRPDVAVRVTADHPTNHQIFANVGGFIA